MMPGASMLNRYWVLAGLLVLAGATCATTRAAFDPEVESCDTAADCAVTGFVSCCACDAEPRAVNRAALAKRTEVCTVGAPHR